MKNEAGPYGNLAIYECSSDNTYDLIFSDTSSYAGPLATHAFGDFDQDGHKEVVFAGADNTYWIYESPANNTYEKLYFGFLPTGNIRDCIAVADADGDGKWEFVIKGFAIFGTIDAFIFESIGNNVYDTVKVFQFPGGDYYGGHSDAGDVDGDSIPEIVLEARQTVHIIKAAGNDSFYVWQTLPGSTYGMNIRIFDLDNNGYAEIIMSSEWQTWIYEWQPNSVEEGKLSDLPLRTMLAGIFPNPVSDCLRINYQLAEPSSVKLAVYDVAGRQVRALTEAAHDPGYYQMIWDAKDDQGRAVPAGVYFVRLTTDKYCHSEKAILMR